MKIWAGIVIVCVVFSVVIVGAVHILDMRQRQAIQTLETKRQSIMNMDSVHNIWERRIMDSMQNIVALQDRRIQVLQVQVKKIHKDNEELQDRYNRITVSMPDF